MKSAYRSLAKKYHPDNYADSPLADLASEKMKEINEAYDQIVNERKNRASGGSYGRQRQAYGGSAEYLDVRNLIVANRIADAEQILDGVPPESRSADWYFLKGTILYKRGWLNEAYDDLAHACQMDPSNEEYRAALTQLGNQRSGMYGGYNPNVPASGSCTGCDVCTSLCVAQTCCDCFGGMGPWC